MSRWKLVCIVIVFCFSVAGVQAAADTTTQQEIKSLKKENALLKQRTENLEREMAELKAMIAGQTPAKSKPVEQAPPVKLTEDDYKKIIALTEQKNDKKPLWSNLDVEFYGYLKGDASYDTSRVTTGNYAVWVDNEASNSNDNEFNLTANQTRIGFKFKGPQDDSMRTSGQLEMDFYGNGLAENKAGILLRHAYMKFEWPEEQLSLLIGQTSDVFSPLVPDTLNYTVLWDAGNIGYRHPQIRLTKDIDLSESVRMKLQGAVSRTIGDDELTGKSGEDSGFPTIQGRVGLTFPSLFGYKDTTIGLSGHWGSERYTTSTTVTGGRFNSWSLNFDCTQPVNEWLSFKGELFCGTNLNDYFGGIGQGVRTTGTGTVGDPTVYHNDIASRGGWIQASFRPKGKWSYNVGAGVDDVEDSDINANGRGMNQSVFGNAIYAINENTQVGFELSYWSTDYKGAGDSEDLRGQTSFIYKF